MKKKKWITAASIVLFIGVAFGGLSLAPDVKLPAPHEQGIWPDVLENVPEEQQVVLMKLIDDYTKEGYGIEYILIEVYVRIDSYEEEDD